jgi:hypothetical protein
VEGDHPRAGAEREGLLGGDGGRDERRRRLLRPAGASQTSVRLELEYEPEGVVENVADKAGLVGRRVEADLEKFKSFIEDAGYASGAWRGTVPGVGGTPGVEAAASSQGDSGSTGISAKTVVAGAAAAAGAAGLAAAAAKAASGGSGSETRPADVTPVETETVVVDVDPVVSPDAAAAPAPPLDDDPDRRI